VQRLEHTDKKPFSDISDLHLKALMSVSKKCNVPRRVSEKRVETVNFSTSSWSLSLQALWRVAVEDEVTPTTKIDSFA